MGLNRADKQDDRRRQILAAALSCFQEKGFAGASIADVCKAAGMSPGHVYHYFRSKDDIIVAIAEADRAAAAQAIEVLAQKEDLLEAILQALDPVTDLGEFGLDGRLAFDVFAEAGRNPRVGTAVANIYKDVQAKLSDMIAREQESGKIPGGIDPAGAALAITALVEGLGVMAVSHGEQEIGRAAPEVRRAIRAILGRTDASNDGSRGSVRSRRNRTSQIG